MAFAMAGYQLVHHGEGRWNGVAIAARDGLAIDDVVTNFGDGPVRDSGPGGAGAEVASEDDFDPFDEARMVAATVDGLRVVSLYAPNGRIVDSPFYAGKLAWFERLARWIREDADADARARPRRRPQRRPDRRRRLGRRGRPRRDARLRTRARGVPGAARRRAWSTPTGRAHASRAASPGGTTGPACSTRTSACGSTTCWSRRRSRARGRRRRDRPRSAQGAAGPVRSRPACHRPRRAGQAVRPRLGRGSGPDPGEDKATEAVVPARLRGRGAHDGVPQDPACDVVGRAHAEEALV